MTKIVFHTNLDEAKPSVQNLNQDYYGEGREWKGPIPPVNSRIQFKVPFDFELMVHSLTFSSDGTEVEVDLHLPPKFYGPTGSIQEFMDWWKKQKDISHCENVAGSFENKNQYLNYCKDMLGFDPVWASGHWNKIQREKK